MRRRGSAVIAAIGVALVPTLASAHELASPSQSPRLQRAARQLMGEGVTPLAGGLYRVPIRGGHDIATHGPDPAPGPVAEDTYPDYPLGAGAPQRPPHCATDRYQQVLYAHFEDGPNQLATATTQIRAIVERMDALLDQESIASGGPAADYKVLCDANSHTRVDSVAVPTSYLYEPDFQSVVEAARAAGFDDPHADYTIFADSDPALVYAFCGLGSLSDDDSATNANRNNNFGGVGSGYALILGGCWTSSTPMHEVGHNEGAVQTGAPYATGINPGGGGHCFDSDLDYDVMCYSTDGGLFGQGEDLARCTDLLHFDCGHDTYFDSAPEPGEWLASHWNLGACANLFMDLGCPPDTTAPDTSITGGPSGSTTSTGASFAFTSTEAGSGFRCRLDGAAFSPCTSPMGYFVGAGAHTFQVRAVDVFENADPSPASRSWSVLKKKKKKRKKKKKKKGKS